MLLKEIINFLESKAHLSYQEPYDNSGLIVGSPDVEITGAIVSLDCTEAVIDEAIAKGFNLVISHHPIVFKGLKRFNGNTYVERVVMKAIKHDVAVYAIHTNLDNVFDGVNHKIASMIGLQDLEILSKKASQLQKLVTFVPKDHLDKVAQTLFDAGAGEIGKYDECSFVAEGLGSFKPSQESNPFIGKKGVLHRELESRLEVIFERHKAKAVLNALFTTHPYEEVAYYLQNLENKHQNIGSGLVGNLPAEMTFSDFVSHLKDSMNLKTLKSTSGLTNEIKRIALCGGAGSFLLNAAISAKADIYISADFKYHEFFDADSKIVIMDIGHFESERFTIDLIHDWLREKFATFALLKTEVNTNPINYF